MGSCHEIGLSWDGSSRARALTRRLVAYRCGLLSWDVLDPCRRMGSALAIGWNGLLAWDVLDFRHEMEWTVVMGSVDSCHGVT